MHKLLIVLALIAILIIAKKIKVHVLTPGGMFLLIWCLMVFFATILWTPKYDWNYKGVYWILCACVCCEIGMYLGGRYRSAYYKQIGACVNYKIAPNSITLTKLGWKILAVVVILAFVKFLYSFVENGFRLSDLLHFSEYLERVSEINSSRYDDGNGSAYVGQILSVFMYAAPMCGGFCYRYSRSWKQMILCVSSLLPVFLLAAMTTAKSGLIAVTGLWIIGMSFSKLFCYRRDVVMSKSTARKAIAFLLVLMLILYGFMLMRAEAFSLKAMREIKDKFFVYGFGGVSAFDNWFGNYREGGYGLGKYTFRAIASLITDIDRKSGIYSLLPGYSDSNIFTMFRPLIDDFGVYGALFVCGIIGYASSRWNNVIKAEINRHYIVVLAYTSLYFYVFWGFIISAWVYTTYMLIFPAFLAFFVIATNNTSCRYPIEIKVKR